MYQVFLILILTALYSSAVPVIENTSSHTEVEQIPDSINEAKFKQIPNSFNEAMFSDQYFKDAPLMFENETYACPNLTKPGCETKTTLNTMLTSCQVCVAREHESCDPFLDACEAGTLCLPVDMENIDVNVCTKISVDELSLVVKLSKIDTKIFEDKPATKIQPTKNQRRRKCGKKFGRKCLRRQQKNKKMLKRNRLPKKFAKSKNPCKAHRRYLKKRKSIKSWKLHCTKDGFYSTTKKTCHKSKCWCVNKNGFFVKKASKSAKKSC